MWSFLFYPKIKLKNLLKFKTQSKDCWHLRKDTCRLNHILVSSLSLQVHSHQGQWDCVGYSSTIPGMASSYHWGGVRMLCSEKVLCYITVKDSKASCTQASGSVQCKMLKYFAAWEPQELHTATHNISGCMWVYASTYLNMHMNADIHHWVQSSTRVVCLSVHMMSTLIDFYQLYAAPMAPEAGRFYVVQPWCPTLRSSSFVPSCHGVSPMKTSVLDVLPLYLHHIVFS